MTTVKELMTSRLHVIRPESTLRSAAQVMKDNDIGILPVITEDGKAVGTITDRDIAIRGVAEGHAPNDAPVSEAMTSGVEYYFADAPIDELILHMGGKRLRRMVVVDRESKGITGIISIGDLASKVEDKKLAGTVLAACVGT
jgi:CBS domain-containing protein